ncbi:hypothetical protein G7046_g7945 [Stylonectria norvegica]|nr:hypothetical protein G7046_g7945 [Stylonectria norvegica]
MFEGFTSFSVTTENDPDVTIAGLRSNDTLSSLPPILLLHGFPQTRHIWHRVAPKLTHSYSVVIIDIRGYGDSSKPGDLKAYAKSAMARDCIKVMDHLGFSSSFFVCAHDRGARISHKLCVDYPDRVKKAIFLDICPTLAMYTATDFDFANAYWHWFFLIQKEPLPESLILGSSKNFAELFMARQQPGLGIFEKECWGHYVKGLEDAASVHAMCQDYRASATLDLQEARDDLASSRLIRSPLLVLWGKHGVIEKCFDAIKEWQAVAQEGNIIQGRSVDSGHYMPEEVPDTVVSSIREFLV